MASQDRKDYIKQLAEMMMTLFPPSPDAHGRLSGWAVDENGQKIVGSKQQHTEKRTPVLKDYIYHLVSPQSKEPRGIGIYPIDYVNKTVRFIVIDVDEDSERARQAMMNACELVRMRGGYPYLERTTQNRWHLWYFPEKPMTMQTAKYVATSLAWVVKSMRVPTEIYPATFYPEPLPRTGKYVNLPYRGACYGVYSEKETSYDLLGVTHLINPFEMDDEDNDDSEECVDGKRIPIFSLEDVCLNPPEVSKELEKFGRQIEADEDKRKQQERIRQGKNKVGNKNARVNFDEVIEALSTNAPRVGDRHACILAAAGAAFFRGISEEEATDRIVECAKTWSKNGERRDWHGEVSRAVKSSYQNGKNGRTTGVATLIRMGIVK